MITSTMLSSIRARWRDSRRVRRRFERIDRLLGQRDVSHLPPDLQTARARTLSDLRAYYRRGVFPHNDAHPGQHRPAFIDRDGRLCAVAHLLIRSGHADAARHIASVANDYYVRDMAFPELDAWVARSGLSKQELALIQPSYACTFNADLYHANGILSGLLTISGLVGSAGILMSALNIWAFTHRRRSLVTVLGGLTSAALLVALTLMQHQAMLSATSLAGIAVSTTIPAFSYEPCPQLNTFKHFLAQLPQGWNNGALLIAFGVALFSLIALLPVAKARRPAAIRAEGAE